MTASFVGACLLGVALAGSPQRTPAPKASKEADAFGELLANPPEKARALADMARALEGVHLQVKGEPRIEGVRRRLGALEALAGGARPLFRDPDPRVRLAALVAVASAHERFADELESMPRPEAAQGETERAWREQLTKTLTRVRLTSAAHLRACRDLDLPKELRAVKQSCGRKLERSKPSVASPRSPAALVTERQDELKPCLEDWTREEKSVEVQVGLSLDGQGWVEKVDISPKQADLLPLHRCLIEKMELWVFPETGEADIELPLKLQARE